MPIETRCLTHMGLRYDQALVDDGLFIKRYIRVDNCDRLAFIARSEVDELWYLLAYMSNFDPIGPYESIEEALIICDLLQT